HHPVILHCICSPGIRRFVPQRVAVLVHSLALVLVPELAPQQAARIVRNAAQPLLHRLGAFLLAARRRERRGILHLPGLALGLARLGFARGPLERLAQRLEVVRVRRLAVARRAGRVFLPVAFAAARLLRLLPGRLAAAVVRALALFPGVRLAALLARALLLFEQPLDEVAVVGRVLVIRVELERALPRGDRLG